MATMLFACVGGVAGAGAAPPVGKDGKIHACYRVKGKPKGSLRVVPAAKRCKRGERKVVWSVAGSNGQAGKDGTSGQAGADGQSGATGAPGQAGTSANEAALKTEIASLTLKLEGLEGILGGITHNDLLNVQATLNGLTNADLTEAVASLPVVESLCSQSEGLTDQVNLVGKGVSEISLGGTLPAGLTLKLPTLTPLGAFTC